jgi:hypothetical protein
MATTDTIRLIGFSTFHRLYADLSRSEFLKLAHCGTFGAVARHGRRVMVSERAVRQWVRAGCKPMRVLVQAQSSDSSRPGDGRDNALARAGKLRPVDDSTQSTPESVGAPNA